MTRADEWRLIEELCELADEEGPIRYERETRNQGEQWERTINPLEAISTAGRMLNAISAGRRVSENDIARAQSVIRRSRWHKSGGK